MVCEHPTCLLEANTICKYHCHLSVCQQHRIEHEKKLLNEFEKHLDDLSKPISTLLNQSRLDLKDSEESRQRELEQINSLFDRHFIFIEQNSKLSKTTTELISHKRKQLINYQTGDNQLTKEDYQQIQNLSKDIQTNLQQQSQLNNQIRNKDQYINSWSIDTNRSTDIECIELSDSEEEQSENSSDIIKTEPEPCSSNLKVNKKGKLLVTLVQEFCPLTKFGIFGLKRSHNLPRLCAKSTNRRRYLYYHLTHSHCLKSRIANKICKAVRDGYDPMKTIIFPQDNTEVTNEKLPCPFDSSATKFNEKNFIPNTPCTSTLNYHYLKHHLRAVHSITQLNASLILKAMKKHGTISHVQFEQDLCEIN